MANELNNHDSYVTESGRKVPALLPTAYQNLKLFLKPLSSLQLTVTLFALSIILVFYGTLAQKTNSTWTAVDDYFRSPLVFIPNQLTAEFLSTFCENWVGKNPKWSGSIPFPGGWTLGGLFLLNLISAHMVRFKLSWKRSGIIIVHLGIILLLLSELLTGLFAVESHMIMRTGDKTNFLNTARKYELAFTKIGDPKYDEAITISQKMLKEGAKITDAELPVDVQIVEYWENSDLLEFDPATKTEKSLKYIDRSRPRELFDHEIQPTDHFFKLQDGSDQVLTRKPIITGVEASEKENVPSITAKFYKKGTSELIGEYRLPVWDFFYEIRGAKLFPKVIVEHDGQKYSAMFRNERIYRPYSIELLKFEHKVYDGTKIPRDFASTVKLEDPQEKYTRDGIRIWMNNPLRYRGESFFQHQTMGDGNGTVLMVVQNPARLWPYISCFLVTFGLVVQFTLSLATRQRNAAAKLKKEKVIVPPRSLTLRAIPLLVALISAAWLASKYDELKTASGDPIYKKLALIPIMEEGRVMPLDSFARGQLQSISNRTEVYKWNAEKNKAEFSMSAIEWILDTLNNPESNGLTGIKNQIFRIDNDQLLGLLELKPRPGFFRYSIEEIRPRFEALEKQSEQSLKKVNKERDIFDDKVLLLHSKLENYIRIAQGFAPHLFPPRDAGGHWRTSQEQNEDLKKFAQDPDERISARQKAKAKIESFVKTQYGKPENIPADVQPRLAEIEETIIVETIYSNYLEKLPKDVKILREIIEVHQAGKGEKLPELFDKLNEDYAAIPNIVKPGKIALESRLNFLSPFYYCSFLYLTSAILILISLLFGRVKVLSDTAFAMTAVTLLVHVTSLIARMIIQERPPVTNLYSSAIFIGMIAVGLSLIFDRVLKSEIPTLAGNFIGAATLFIAHIYLSATGDTLGMLQAVLDTDFWLATHVTSVTIGYSVTFLAGFLGMTYVVASFFPTRFGAKNLKYLAGMIYGSVCLALLFSFLGTVLGGLWADYSWGRFWGWDPKENGAVLVVIWNALILHARWCGLVKDRGIATLALVGNMITTWSWFGTNQLGIGLHAYGFDKGLAEFCRWAWLSQIALIVLALSYRPKIVAPPAKPV